MRVRHRGHLEGLGAALLLAAIFGGCTGSGDRFGDLLGSPTPAASATQSSTPGLPRSSSPQPSTAPRESGPNSLVSAGTTTVNNITVDYTYRSDYITCLAHLYGTNLLASFLIVTVANDSSSDLTLSVSSEITDYTTRQTDQVKVGANSSTQVSQNPRLTQAALDSLTSLKPAQLHLVVSWLDNGVQRTVLDQTNDVNVWSRRDFPWYVKGMTPQEDFELLAVMVTPLDPAVEALISHARKYAPGGVMDSGYNSDDDADGSVHDRLAALWKAETDADIGYVSTTVSFAPTKPQRIKLPSEVIADRSGNCIELTLLLASAVEALGMQPEIVLVPGHAYLGVRTDDTNDSYYFIETTMIGQSGFESALTEGGNEWDKDQPHIDREDTDYGWVSIPTSRSEGITPMPWH